MDSTYPRAVLAAALQGLLTGAWVAAGELPTARRRLARAGSVLSLSAVASIGDRAEPEEPAAEPRRPREVDARTLAVTAASIGISVGLIVGRRRLEQRWLGALTRADHPYPYRALGLRMGLLSFAGTLPGKLVEVYEGRRPR